MNLHDLIANKWKRHRGEQMPPDQTTQGAAYKPSGRLDTWSFSVFDKYEWLQDQLRVGSRAKNLQLYREMDEEFPEIASALDIYADNATQIGVGDTRIISIISKSEALRKLLLKVSDRLMLENRVWATARALARDGDVFEEIVVTNSLRLDRLKKLPSELMIRNEDRYGLLDRNEAFIQVDENFEKKIATFEDWEVLHFRLLRDNEDRYGTSLLHPIRRVYKQLRLVEESMLLTRITRASSKLVHFVDVGNLTPAQADEHIKKVRSEYKKRMLVDVRTGRVRTDINPMMVDEDIFIPTRDGSKADVKQLYGDVNIGNLDDVEMFQNKLFAGLKVPKSYLGFERDVNSKATLNQQDIQFARSVRRLQNTIISGYRQLFELAWTLEGQGAMPEFQIRLPMIKTIDELREWEMKRIQSEVARIWSQELLLEPVEVLMMILGFSKEQATRLYKGENSAFAKTFNKNQQAALRAVEDKRFAEKVRETVETIGVEQLTALKELCQWTLEQAEFEDAIERGEVN